MSLGRFRIDRRPGLYRTLLIDIDSRIGFFTMDCTADGAGGIQIERHIHLSAPGISTRDIC